MNGESKQQRQKQRAQQEKSIQAMLTRVTNTIVVLSGKGGVGKSTVAVNLAIALAEAGHNVGLMDVDLHGPSVPRMLGLERAHASIARGHITPVRYTDNLKVVSIENMMPEHDQALIWRGPIKIGVIRQFLADVAWGDLDYLIIDSPPGTGDEPLTVAQTLTGAQAVIVTTPQEVSLADVRKSINFCRAVDLPILGMIENMSGYVCPACGHREDIFGTGGGERTATEMGIAFLGAVPLDGALMRAGDAGDPGLASGARAPFDGIFKGVIEKLVAAQSAKREKVVKLPTREQPGEKQPMEPEAKTGELRIAVPTANGLLCAHFGHCEVFTVFDIKDKKVVHTQELQPPQHEPGVLPRWLREHDADVIIAGGMGNRARQFFTDFGIEVVVGAPARAPQSVVEEYLSGTLVTGDNICDH